MQKCKPTSLFSNLILTVLSSVSNNIRIFHASFKDWSHLNLEFLTSSCRVFNLFLYSSRIPGEQMSVHFLLSVVVFFSSWASPLANAAGLADAEPVILSPQNSCKTKSVGVQASPWTSLRCRSVYLSLEDHPLLKDRSFPSYSWLLCQDAPYRDFCHMDNCPFRIMSRTYFQEFLSHVAAISTLCCRLDHATQEVPWA